MTTFRKILQHLAVKVLWISVLSLAVVFSANVQSVIGAEYDECIHIVGTEAIKETQTIDPAFQWSTDDAMHTWNVYEPLVALDEAFVPKPRLAVSWEPNSDSTQWTFHLRKGVKFHDGSSFDAEDVVYTFQRLIDPKVASPSQPMLSFISKEGVEALDQHTVRFTFKKPIAEFPILMSTKHALIVPSGSSGETLASKGNGTGAFMVEKFERGGPVRILRKNPNYWDPELPKAECLKITANNDPLSLTAMLISGEADYAPDISPTTARSLKGNKDIDLLTAKTGSFLTYVMWVDTPPFDNPKVREAMKLVVDREVIVNSVFMGFAVPANDNPVPIHFPEAYTKNIKKRDVAKAKALLEQAGFKDGLEVDLYAGEIQMGTVKGAEVYAQMASEAGIKVNVIKTPADSYWDDVWKKRPFCMSSWQLRNTPAGLSVAYKSTAPWNESHIKRQDLDEAIEKADMTTDQAKRFEYYKEAQRIISEEGGSIIPALATSVNAFRKNCTGFIPNSTAKPDYRYLNCK
jgi:peptide/nickel transport system substrate-binding protein